MAASIPIRVAPVNAAIIFRDSGDPPGIASTGRLRENCRIAGTDFTGIDTLRPLLAFALLAWSAWAGALPLETLRLPKGFAIELWARVDNARQMALGGTNENGGVLYVGSRGAGRVHAVRFDAGYRAGTVTRIADGLQMPSGLAWKDGALYVGAVNRILRYDDIDRRIGKPPAPVVVTDTLPKDTHHGWKFIAFGPDGKLYVPVGAPCNICDRDADGYANIILRMNADGSSSRCSRAACATASASTGSRDEGAVVHRQRARLDGRRAALVRTQPCAARRHAFRLPVLPWRHDCRSRVRRKRRVQRVRPPAANLGPHVAPLGMRFYTGTMFPAEYRDQHLHRRARLVEPREENRLPDRPVRLEATGWLPLRDLRQRLAAGRVELGPPGRRAGAAGRLAAGRRRPCRRDLPHHPWRSGRADWNRDCNTQAPPRARNRQRRLAPTRQPLRCAPAAR
jgi:glucose/arabinose dehydrogenase